jgi:UMF1 family MFS transporter
MADQQSASRAPKKGIWGWMLFDWATQPFHTLILTFIFAPYFVAQVASNPVDGQADWGYAIGIGGIIIAILSPILGAIADATGPRKPWILIFVAMAAAGSFYLWNIVPDADETLILWGLVALVVGLAGVEFATVFNNAMMPDLVPREELGRLSGNAWALGYIGGLLCLIVMLALMVASPESGKTLIGMEPIFGLNPAMAEGERASGLLTAGWILIFVIPMFLFTPDTAHTVKVTGAVANGLRDLLQTLKNLPSNPSLFAYLGSSMLYRDALNGLYTFGGIYAAGVLEWEVTQVGIFGILAAITGAIGAYFGGRMDDKYGPKPVVVFSLLLLTLASILIITTDQTHVLFMEVGTLDNKSGLPDLMFYACGGLIGAGGGSIQAASRTLLVDQADPERMTEAFGLYALSGKATSFIAPLSVAFVTVAFGSQQIGVIPIIILFLLGLFLLPFVKGRGEA